MVWSTDAALTAVACFGGGTEFYERDGGSGSAALRLAQQRQHLMEELTLSSPDHATGPRVGAGPRQSLGPLVKGGASLGTLDTGFAGSVVTGFLTAAAGKARPKQSVSPHWGLGKLSWEAQVPSLQTRLQECDGDKTPGSIHVGCWTFGVEKSSLLCPLTHFLDKILEQQHLIEARQCWDSLPLFQCYPKVSSIHHNFFHQLTERLHTSSHCIFLVNKGNRFHHPPPHTVVTTLWEARPACPSGQKWRCCSRSRSQAGAIWACAGSSAVWLGAGSGWPSASFASHDYPRSGVR